MPPVIQPAWLLLILFSALLFLILMGCSAVYNRTPTNMPSETPPMVTLTVVNRPTATPPIIPTQRPTSIIPPLLLSRVPIPLMPNSPDLEVLTPTCYDTLNQGILCLGQVYNPLNRPTEAVRIQVDLLDASGTAIAEQSIGLEQRTIHPAEYAPYRALFNDVRVPYTRAEASFEAADFADHVPPPLTVEDERGLFIPADMGYGRYVVTANIANLNPDPIEQVQVIVTVLDEFKRVVGYRVLRLIDGIASNEREAIRVEIVPQIVSDQLTHFLTVDVWDRGN